MIDGPLRNKLWVEKYRPTCLSDYIFHNQAYRNQIHQMVLEKHIPNMLLSGYQGSGKTTLAFVLIKELSMDPTDVLVINASDENSVDTIRDKVKSFVSAAPNGDFKLVLLEEADYISHNGQAALRRLMEEYSYNARFILTCNYINKIIPMIKSRCSAATFTFKTLDKNDIAERLVYILHQENIKFDLSTLDQYIDSGFPDIRSILGSIQQSCVDGKLSSLTNLNDSNQLDYRSDLSDLIKQDKWHQIRTAICSQIEKEEYESVYRFMYDNLHFSPKFSNPDKWEQGIILIAHYLYTHSLVADPEINLAALMLELKRI